MSRHGIFGWDLPPGTTTAHLDAAFGGDDGPCGAQSPDGKFACTRGYGHDGDKHETSVEHVSYRREPDCAHCANGTQKPATLDGYPACEHEVVTPGEWFDSNLLGGSGEWVVIATWPVRDDDFDEDGNPTQRSKKAATVTT